MSSTQGEAPDPTIEDLQKTRTQLIYSKLDLIAARLELMAAKIKTHELDLPASLQRSRDTAGTPNESANSLIAKDRSSTISSKGAESLLGIGTKLFGLATAIVTFLFTAKHLLTLYRAPLSASSTSSQAIDAVTVIAFLIGWYFIVRFLFWAGGVFHEIFDELWRLAVELVKRKSWLKLTEKGWNELRGSAPKIFHLGWDLTVVILAILPAYRYAAHVVAIVTK